MTAGAGAGTGPDGLPVHLWLPGPEGAPTGLPGVVPAAGDAVGPPPLLLLHGTGADERSLVPLAGRLSPGSSLLAVRGRVLEGSMPRFFARHAEGVFDEDDLRARTDELADDLAVMSDRYGVVPGSWVAIGFSNGANIASSLLLRRPEALAGAVLFGAMVPFREPVAAPGDLAGPDEPGGRWAVISNGDADPIATPDHTRRLAQQLGEHRVRVQLLGHDRGHAVHPAVLDDVAVAIAAGGGSAES